MRRQHPPGMGQRSNRPDGLRERSGFGDNPRRSHSRYPVSQLMPGGLLVLKDPVVVAGWTRRRRKERHGVRNAGGVVTRRKAKPTLCKRAHTASCRWSHDRSAVMRWIAERSATVWRK